MLLLFCTFDVSGRERNVVKAAVKTHSLSFVRKPTSQVVPSDYRRNLRRRFTNDREWWKPACPRNNNKSNHNRTTAAARVRRTAINVVDVSDNVSERQNIRTKIKMWCDGQSHRGTFFLGRQFLVVSVLNIKLHWSIMFYFADPILNPQVQKSLACDLWYTFPLHEICLSLVKSFSRRAR